MNLSYFYIILHIVFKWYYFIYFLLTNGNFVKISLYIFVFVIFNNFLMLNSYSYSEEDLKKLLKTNICINCDLSGADFKKADFSYSNLQGSNLNGANLWRANFSNSNLKNCSIEQANLKRVNFKNANLNGATFQWSIIRHAIMDGSTAFKADFRKTKIKKTNLKLVKFCETLMPYGIDNSGCDK